MYHSIDNGDNPLSVGINNFNKQMKLLYNFGFQTIDIDDIYCNKKNKKKFIITFDDGYKDNLLNALPILKKYNFVSTCFVVNDMIGKFNLWDNDKKNFNKKELMNENDINEWLKNGQKIGSHSSSHKNSTPVMEMGSEATEKTYSGVTLLVEGALNGEGMADLVMTSDLVENTLNVEFAAGDVQGMFTSSYGKSDGTNAKYKGTITLSSGEDYNAIAYLVENNEEITDFKIVVQ